jgi:ankyrin repeat protein
MFRWRGLHVLDLFIEHGADLTVVDNAGRNMVHYIAYDGSSVAHLELAVQAGCDIHLVDKDGNNAFHHYCSSRSHSLEMLSFLIDNRVDIMLENRKGLRPLDMLSKFSDFSDEHIRLLVAYGVNMNIVYRITMHDQNGGAHQRIQSFLHRGFSAETTQLLIEHGADMHLEDGDGVTPFEHYVMWNDFDAALLLLRKGVDVNRINSKGDTLLHRVITDADDDYSQVFFLIRNGADVTIADSNGNTPLHLVAGKDKEVVFLAKRLIEKGADVSAVYKDGKTPIDIAKAWWHQRLVRLLERVE